MKTGLISKVIVTTLAVMLMAACGGSGSEPTQQPTAEPATPTTEPEDTPAPQPADVTEADSRVEGFAELAACLEDRLGSEVAQALVSGERQETPVERAVLEGCLLLSASGAASQDLSSGVTACLEERLGAGIVTIVGSGARPLTADEEEVLLDCVVSSALAPGEPETISTLDACLIDRLGAEIAAVVASGAVPLNETEQAILIECQIQSALDVPQVSAEDSVTACLAERLGAAVAAVVASGAIPLTEEEEAVVGDCLLAASLETSAETLAQAVTACLAERLGTDVAAVVASGAIPLNDVEEEVLGECLLSSSLDTSSDTVSQTVTACLEEQLGGDIAAVVASGVIPLTSEEEAVMGECLLQDALGGSR